jgi:glycosyltransferase involved in cell wall biosynthesis
VTGSPQAGSSVGVRLGAGSPPRPPGVRVVLDVRPLQAPDRSPLAAAYLDGLLTALDDDPLEGESFSFLLAADLDDVTERFARLDVASRRQLPPTRLLRSGAMTVDPFILRSAAFGTTWRADRRGAAGAVYHAVGSGPLPIASGLPVVVTLLDLAPWELPDIFGRSIAGRFGQRLRTQQLRDASAIIVSSDATARSVRRLLRIRAERIHVVRLAPRPGFNLGPERSDQQDGAVDLRDHLGLGTRYLVLPGRFDARMDLATLLSALALLARSGRPSDLPEDVSWPPRILLVGASPDDRASIARAAARKGVGESIAYAPGMPTHDLAALVRRSRGVILPVISEATGLPVVEAQASGIPVVASSVGPLPELVGQAGLLVEPGDADRLALAINTLWADDPEHRRLVEVARERAAGGSRTWADVARETREVYGQVGASRRR